MQDRQPPLIELRSAVFAARASVRRRELGDDADAPRSTQMVRGHAVRAIVPLITALPHPFTPPLSSPVARCIPP